jgi:hypothetical protein
MWTHMTKSNPNMGTWFWELTISLSIVRGLEPIFKLKMVDENYAKKKKKYFKFFY